MCLWAGVSMGPHVGPLACLGRPCVHVSGCQYAGSSTCQGAHVSGVMCPRVGVSICPRAWAPLRTRVGVSICPRIGVFMCAYCVSGCPRVHVSGPE
jgi:hypothetical protein